MGLENNNLIIIFLSCLFFTSFFFIVNAEVADGKTSFSYVVGAPDGPQNWTNLNQNWTLCGTGRSQSPINIIRSRLIVNPSLGDLNRQYRPAPARIINSGHDIMVEWTGDAGSIVIKGTRFNLSQCHWHIPSEHTVNGRRFDMELHAVHSNAKKDIAVVGILYNSGAADPFLTQIAPFIPSSSNTTNNIGIVDPSNIGFPNGKYYRYNGSLTTPPCSENVTWTIFKTVKTVSPQQIATLKNAVDDGNTGNARPIQALNGRPVYLYKTRRKYF